MDPLTEPSISHPQSPLPRTMVGTGQIPAGGVEFIRHCQQRPSQRAQHARLRRRRRRSPTRTARCRAPSSLQVKCRILCAVLDRSKEALSGRCRRVATLRMVGVPVRDTLRVKGLPLTLSLRMAGVFRD